MRPRESGLILIAWHSWWPICNSKKQALFFHLSFLPIGLNNT